MGKELGDNCAVGRLDMGRYDDGVGSTGRLDGISKYLKFWVSRRVHVGVRYYM